MPESLTSGLGIVLLAGLFQGSFMLPSKFMRGWAWENYWLIFAVSAYLICPWLLAFSTIPRLLEVYSEISPASLASVALYGTGWGIGAVTFGLGVDAIGLSLGFAVILGVAATSGTLIPLLVLKPAGFSFEQSAVTGAALSLLLVGVAICSFAGKWREKDKTRADRRSYWRGVGICVASGLLSACGNLGFAFSADIARRAQDLGAPDHLAANALWSLLTLPLLLCNAGYSIYLLQRNGTVRRFQDADSGRSFVLAFSMGVMWMAGMALYGAGARRLGSLGPSLGWAILMSSMVLVANALGFLTGEWKPAPKASKRQLGFGVMVLLLAISALGYANYLQAK